MMCPQGPKTTTMWLIYLKGTLGIWREEKTDEKFWRGAQVYRHISLLEIGRRVKCKISFWREKKWENDCILVFSRSFHSQGDFLIFHKRITSVWTEVFLPAKFPTCLLDKSVLHVRICISTFIGRCDSRRINPAAWPSDSLSFGLHFLFSVI